MSHIGPAAASAAVARAVDFVGPEPDASANPLARAKREPRAPKLVSSRNVDRVVAGLLCESADCAAELLPLSAAKEGVAVGCAWRTLVAKNAGELERRPRARPKPPVRRKRGRAKTFLTG